MTAIADPFATKAAGPMIADPYSVPKKTTAPIADPFSTPKATSAINDPFATPSKTKTKKGDVLSQTANTLKGLATKPLEAIDAVLGAPERAVEGTVAGMTRAHGDVVGALGHGAYEAFHPRDTKTREQNLGMVEAGMGIPKTKGLAKAGVDFGVQTMLDPLTYIPFIGEGRWAERGLKSIADAIPSAIKSNETLGQVVNFFKANPQIDRALSQNGANVYRGVYSSERAKSSAEAQRNALVLAADRKAIEAGLPTPNFDRRLDELAYVHGDEDMRRQVEQRGIFKPTPEQAAQPPTGYLPHYNLLEDYFPQFEAKGLPEVQPFTRVTQKGEAATPYAKPRTGEAMPESSPMDRATRRLALAQARIFEKSVDARLEAELAKGGISHSDVQGIDFLRQGGEGLGQSHVAGFKPLNFLSNAYRQALFINPLPHMFNIARLAYLAGGAKTVARGFGYMLGGAPEKLAQETEHFVGSPLYLAGEGGLADRIPGIRQLRDFGQHKLTAFDKAMRQAYLAEVKGKGPATYAHGQQVRQGIGDYDQSSRAVDIARAAGAPFAQWRLGVVPGAMARATVRNPERVERYARGMTDLSQQTGPFEFSGPEEDFGRLVTAPYGTARYIMSPSTVGPVLSQLHNLAGLGGSPTIKTVAEQLLRSYVPGGGSIEEAFGLSPYKESDNVKLNLLLSLLGGYTTGKPKAAP